MKRVYLSRDSIRKPSVYEKNHGLIYTVYRGVGEKDYASGFLYIISGRTGRISRRVVFNTVEIENISNLFILVQDDMMIKNRDIVKNEAGEIIKLTPVARVKGTNHIIYNKG